MSEEVKDLSLPDIFAFRLYLPSDRAIELSSFPKEQKQGLTSIKNLSRIKYEEVTSFLITALKNLDQKTAKRIISPPETARYRAKITSEDDIYLEELSRALIMPKSKIIERLYELFFPLIVENILENFCRQLDSCQRKFAFLSKRIVDLKVLLKLLPYTVQLYYRKKLYLPLIERQQLFVEMASGVTGELQSIPGEFLREFGLECNGIRCKRKKKGYEIKVVSDIAVVYTMIFYKYDTEVLRIEITEQVPTEYVRPEQIKGCTHAEIFPFRVL